MQWTLGHDGVTMLGALRAPSLSTLAAGASLRRVSRWRCVHDKCLIDRRRSAPDTRPGAGNDDRREHRGVSTRPWAAGSTRGFCAEKARGYPLASSAAIRVDFGGADLQPALQGSRQIALSRASRLAESRKSDVDYAPAARPIHVDPSPASLTTCNEKSPALAGLFSTFDPVGGRASALHRSKELIIRLGRLHLVEHELHRRDLVHRVQ